MEKKCCSKKHKEIDATYYCLECNIFICNKCSNLHSDLFENHHMCNIDKNMQEIFTGKCKEGNHKDELEFYCKTHNILCCVACISKIKNKEYGQHTDCNVCAIEEIKDEKKNKLKDNLKYLEKMSNNIESSINELKKIFDKTNEDKEQLKIKISQIFNKIRNALNEREDELISEVDNRFNKLFFDEDLMNKSGKLPQKIKISLEKGKSINNEWNNSDKLNFKINDCLNIENNIKDIDEINQSIEKFNSIKTKIKLIPENENELNEFMKTIKFFGEIEDDISSDNFKFKFVPGMNYTVSNNGLIAIKTSGGNAWNCSIIGDREIPKNKISKWKIRLNNFEIKGNFWNILIGIGPNNFNNEINFHLKCFSFICGTSTLSIKSGQETKYNSGKLKKGDIIEVIVDRKVGNISYSVNGKNYGIAYSQISKEDVLYPIVHINDQNQIVEIL